MISNLVKPKTLLLTVIIAFIAGTSDAREDGLPIEQGFLWPSDHAELSSLFDDLEPYFFPELHETTDQDRPHCTNCLGFENEKHDEQKVDSHVSYKNQNPRSAETLRYFDPLANQKVTRTTIRPLSQTNYQMQWVAALLEQIVDSVRCSLPTLRLSDRARELLTLEPPTSAAGNPAIENALEYLSFQPLPLEDITKFCQADASPEDCANRWQEMERRRQHLLGILERECLENAQEVAKLFDQPADNLRIAQDELEDEDDHLRSTVLARNGGYGGRPVSLKRPGEHFTMDKSGFFGMSINRTGDTFVREETKPYRYVRDRSKPTYYREGPFLVKELPGGYKYFLDTDTNEYYPYH